jgi:hypothetical protein
MPKIFISHSWEDNELSRKLADYLRRDGAEVWIDYARIAGGDSLPKVISNAIDWCDTLVLVWSKAALDSYWVEEEWTCAHSLRKRIVPCLIDRAKLPAILLSKLHIEISDFDNGYSDLARALKLIVKRKKAIATKEKSEPQPEVVKLEKTIFRSSPKELLHDNVIAIVEKYGFFDRLYNKKGKRFNHQFEQKTINDDKVIIDYASGLMGQQSGSQIEMPSEAAKKYITELNRKQFAGFTDWRLPTLEEAMSLMEPEKKNYLYIDPMFGRKQAWVWTSDSCGDPYGTEERQWVVDFLDGKCCHYYLRLGYDLYIRAVRFESFDYFGVGRVRG